MDDTPHRIALGIAVGVFVGFSPTIGFQMVIAVALATLLRANKVVCIPFVWITNPVTAWPIYLLCYQIGGGLLGSATTPASAIKQLLVPLEQIQSLGVSHVLEVGFWTGIVGVLAQLGMELWVGCTLVGFVAATTSYFISRRAVALYRERRQARVEALATRRSARRFAHRVRARGPLA